MMVAVEAVEAVGQAPYASSRLCKCNNQLVTQPFKLTSNISQIHFKETFTLPSESAKLHEK
jgi:hypothetical protein